MQSNSILPIKIIGSIVWHLGWASIHYVLTTHCVNNIASWLQCDQENQII